MSISSTHCQLDNYELYKDQSNYHCGDGILTLKNIETMIPGQKYTVSLILKSEGKAYPVDYEIVYGNGYTYSLENKDDQQNL